jgi:hypothetical protein
VTEVVNYLAAFGAASVRVVAPEQRAIDESTGHLAIKVAARTGTNDRPLPARAQPPGDQPASPTPSMPPVIIDRIEIITPAAGPPATDPFASVGPRRSGSSRHRGSD